MWRVAFRILLLAAVGAIGLQPVAGADDFAPGQTWYYNGATPMTSRVVIGKIDVIDGGKTVVSVSVVDAPIPTTEGPLQTVGHLPFDEAALQASLIKREGDRSVPAEFADGYHTWRAAFDKGQAGAFKISVADAIQYLKQSVESPSTQPPK